MDYKISGTATEDCKVYVINTSDDSIDQVKSVSAGAYSVDILNEENVHVLAVANDGGKGTVAYSNIQAEYDPFISTIIEGCALYAWDAYSENYTAFGDNWLSMSTYSLAISKSANDFIVFWTEDLAAGGSPGYVYAIRMSNCGSIADAKLVWDGNTDGKYWNTSTSVAIAYIPDSNRAVYVVAPDNEQMRMLMVDDTTLALDYGPIQIDASANIDSFVAHGLRDNLIVFWSDLATSDCYRVIYDAAGNITSAKATWWVAGIDRYLENIISTQLVDDPSEFIGLFYIDQRINIPSSAWANLTQGKLTVTDRNGSIIASDVAVTARNIDTEHDPRIVAACPYKFDDAGNEQGFLVIYSEYNTHPTFPPVSNIGYLKYMDKYGGNQSARVVLWPTNAWNYSNPGICETYDHNYLIVSSYSNNAWYWVYDRDLNLLQTASIPQLAGAQRITVHQNGDGETYSVCGGQYAGGGFESNRLVKTLELLHGEL